MARRDTRIRRARTTISIIVDGKTEVWYLQSLRDEEYLGNLTIKPDLPGNGGVDEQFEMVREHAEIYDQVIWLLDLDTVMKENREGREGISAFQKLKNQMQELGEMENVRVLINTPCLEFWFLLHESRVGSYYDSCKSVARRLTNSRLLPDYKKTERYFKNSRTNVYQRLKPHLGSAIRNARALGNFDIDNPQVAKAETFRLFEMLGIENRK